MSLDNPRWLHEIPDFNPTGKIKKFTKEEKIENEKKFLKCLVEFHEMSQEEADREMAKFMEEIEKG